MVQLQCPYEDCDKTYDKRSKLDIHIRSHTGDRPFGCSNCDKSFIRADHLRRHLLSHSDDQPWQCDHEGCFMSFKHRQHLIRHAKTHERKTFKCSGHECTERFSKKAQLLAHVMRDHLQVSDGDSATTYYAYLCSHESCRRTFDNPSHLRHHMLTVHEATGLFVCGHPDCQALSISCGAEADAAVPQTFASRRELQQHFLTAHQNNHPCPECSKLFGSRKNLREHIRIKHTSLSPVDCELCGRSFATRAYLRKHILNFHASKFHPVCDKCGKSFATKGSLTRHQTNLPMCNIMQSSSGGESEENSSGHKQRPQKKQKQQSSIIKEQITGFGYVQHYQPSVSADSAGNFPCPLEDCPFIFKREYDLMRHIKSPAVHGHVLELPDFADYLADFDGFEVEGHHNISSSSSASGNHYHESHDHNDHGMQLHDENGMMYDGEYDDLAFYENHHNMNQGDFQNLAMYYSE